MSPFFTAPRTQRSDKPETLWVLRSALTLCLSESLNSSSASSQKYRSSAPSFDQPIRSSIRGCAERTKLSIVLSIFFLGYKAVVRWSSSEGGRRVIEFRPGPCETEQGGGKNERHGPQENRSAARDLTFSIFGGGSVHRGTKDGSESPPSSHS